MNLGLTIKKVCPDFDEWQSFLDTPQNIHLKAIYAEGELMGLTSWKGFKVRPVDVTIMIEEKIRKSSKKKIKEGRRLW